MRTFHLRRWQKDALDAFEHDPRRDFLTVATPGAGKTTFALTATLRHLDRYPHRRVVVVAPTSHLKVQWAQAAARFGLQLEPSWQAAAGPLRDMHGIVVTYQQVASDPAAVRPYADDAFVILDEIHHAGGDRAWGAAVAAAFEPAARRLALSGTPFRSDDDPIPFVTYDFEQAVADYTYGYAEALADGGVVRPVFFPAVGGHMEWTAPDGTSRQAAFVDDVPRDVAAQRLRTALSPRGEWLPTVLDQAHQRLTQVRRRTPDAGGLVIAMDVAHAREIARLLSRRHQVSATVVTSDDPAASSQIARFADGTDPWLVAVKMVSEGVDVPRLRVGVWATNTVTELFFRQAVGRLVRWSGADRHQRAFMFLPDDIRLRALGARLGEQRTHALNRPDRDDDTTEDELLDEPPAASADEQMSLFEAISATPSDVDDPVDSDGWDDPDLDTPLTPSGDALVEIMLVPPPPLHHADGAATPEAPRAQVKQQLRQANADRVVQLRHLTGLSPEVINGRLNDHAGCTTIAAATVAQLQRRLQAADRWVATA